MAAGDGPLSDPPSTAKPHTQAPGPPCTTAPHLHHQHRHIQLVVVWHTPAGAKAAVHQQHPAVPVPRLQGPQVAGCCSIIQLAIQQDALPLQPAAAAADRDTTRLSAGNQRLLGAGCSSCFEQVLLMPCLTCVQAILCIHQQVGLSTHPHTAEQMCATTAASCRCSAGPPPNPPAPPPAAACQSCCAHTSAQVPPWTAGHGKQQSAAAGPGLHLPGSCVAGWRALGTPAPAQTRGKGPCSVEHSNSV
jgi:hypothetical protein